ncbi:MAG: 16S rRNA (guanine(527)-N(7))-methyltransferase RsmG [Thermodesulfovibrio sp.]|nr:16S rRNA (guanine(527)-N(7))-methyltransferase RsmG [Thermodesulfovibrio sp.]
MQKLREFIKIYLSEYLFQFKIKEDIEIVLDKFISYLQELKKWNKTYSLTSITDEQEIVVKHFIDSLLYLCFIPEEFVKVADVGSGAGFPGIPIGIVRANINLTLIEPSWKKVAFLKNVKRKLQLKNIDILQAKAEEVNEKFDIVVSRALWSIKDFIKNCKHLIEKGSLIISKSIKIEEELKEIPKNVKIEIKEFILPIFNAKRFIIKLENVNTWD